MTALLLAVHTNLPLYDVEAGGRALVPLLPYAAQGTTDEVQAGARLFRVERPAAGGDVPFAFSAGPVRRWYGIDLYALPLADATRRLDLVAASLADVESSPDGTIEVAVGGAALFARYRLDGPSAWAYVRLEPREPPDWPAFRGVECAVSSDGRPGLLRLRLEERDGEEWIFDDYAALGTTGETRVRAPFRAFANPAWAKRGDGCLAPDRFARLSVGFHPYRGAFGTREATLLRVDLYD